MASNTFFFQSSNEPLARLIGSLEWAVEMLKNPSRSGQQAPTFNRFASEAVTAVEAEIRNRNSRIKRATDAEKENRRKLFRFLVSAASHLDRVSAAYRKVSETAELLIEKHPVIFWKALQIYGGPLALVAVTRPCCIMNLTKIFLVGWFVHRVLCIHLECCDTFLRPLM